MTTYVGDPSRIPVPALGVHPRDGGVDVAVHAAHADAVDFCVLTPAETSGSPWEERRMPLTQKSYGVWHGFVDDVPLGTRYGFRVHGKWDPRSGFRHNAAKLLVDPYARALDGDLSYDEATYGYLLHFTEDHSRDGDIHGLADPRDTVDMVPHSIVVPSLPTQTSTRPRVPWQDTVIYEAHVRGLTQLNPDVPEDLRGTYAGIGHEATVRHLTELGITTIELLPIHAFESEPHLIDKNLTNYWGYNTLGFFAPHAPYATQAARDAGGHAVIDEVKAMVQSLHAAGIEVILDVVYNHTCEGGTGGQHVSWRGLDATGYYLHDGATPASFADVTGCGNTLDFSRPRVVQMALDSMRYWMTTFDVDGFRLDLAVTLARDPEGFNPNHPFLVSMQTDPVLSQAKIIAEPWDIGPGGWQTGNFGAPVAEWNDRYRNCVRGFWLSDARALSHGHRGSGIRELATRLAGSADLFGHSDPPLARGTVASINFVTAHDGFTLADLVAYDHKHNEANGEDGRDGNNDNQSWNHGVEGPLSPDDSSHVIAPTRRRSIRNLLATLLLSAGTPMLTAGDERGRTQRGNNNAYCQDNEISWMSWELNDWRRDLQDTTRYLLELRREHPALRVEDFFSGGPQAHDDDHQPDLGWYGTDGSPLTQDQWNDPGTRIFQMFRRGRIPGTGDEADPHVLLIVNGTLEPVSATLPKQNSMRSWHMAWSSEWERPDTPDEARDVPLGPGAEVALEPLTLQLYVAPAEA
ncbi:glycogen debranching protein GlgX [Jonesia quinghaiensis]|uniref:glycogen debranching protein GlgX n=1 Tax=Jonesia quinghaiensis TaxID=262806 RepID=UPI0004172060|nr:glycogen debranching protein GlgX [Jonesia quinghaiensis]